MQPEETPLGDIERFPPFRGEPMSPVPLSPWAASEPLGGLRIPKRTRSGYRMSSHPHHAGHAEHLSYFKR